MKHNTYNIDFSWILSEINYSTTMPKMYPDGGENWHGRGKLFILHDTDWNYSLAFPNKDIYPAMIGIINTGEEKCNFGCSKSHLITSAFLTKGEVVYIV